MSLAADIIKNISGYSKAMYSTWFYFRSSRNLFDAGEGVSAALANYVFGIEKVFITHSHYDHIGGLPGFILSRKNARGDTEKDLEIYHPAGDDHMENLKKYIVRLARDLPFDLQWIPIDETAGPIPLSSGGDAHFVRPFRTQHTDWAASLGYAVIERRSRLRPEFRGLQQEAIVSLIRERGKPALMEDYEKKLLLYTGDALTVPGEMLRDCEVLMHDATFLDASDRKEPIHATVEEAIQSAQRNRVGALLLFHISHRYSPASIQKKLRSLIDSYRPEFPIYCVFPHKPYLIQRVKV